MSARIRRHLPWLLVATMAALVAVAVVQGCGSSSDGKQAACKKLCACFGGSQDLATCTNVCLMDAESFNSSFFGTQMTQGCYDCINNNTCDALNTGNIGGTPNACDSSCGRVP